MANKPLCLEIDEATRELNSAIEQISKAHGLPCYILELLVSDVLARLQNGKRVEIETARRSYEQQIASEGEKNGNGS